jgi:ABC-type multidrug transport system ATPase subunit
MSIDEQNNSILEVKDLVLSFSGRNIVSGLTFRMKTSDKMVLTGVSGSGKTTVLRTIMGFVKSDNGQVTVVSKKLDENNVWEIRRKIAYVPQEPVLGDGLVEDILKRAFEFKANSHLRWDAEKAKSCFDQLGLSGNLLLSQTAQLSGGEKQRIALVLAILLQRKIFLLDEPVSALDAENAERVNRLFSEAPDITVLCAAHDSARINFANKNLSLDNLKAAN